MKENILYIEALEKAIKEKYGYYATLNPKAFWDEEKEKTYIQETKKVTEKEYISQISKEKIEINGIMVTKKILNNIEEKICKSCKIYSFKREDNLYMNKFNVCYKCYVCNEEK